MTTKGDPVQPSLLDQILQSTIDKISKKERFDKKHIDEISVLISDGVLTQDRLTDSLKTDEEENDENT